MIKGVYTPKYHQDKLYFNIFKKYWHSFVEIYKEKYEKEYGFLQDYQKEIVEHFIKCGDHEKGFAYLECPKCEEAYIVPFSCKTKICNSCVEKKSLIWSEWIAKEVLLNCNHRHLTFSIPISCENISTKAIFF